MGLHILSARASLAGTTAAEPRSHIPRQFPAVKGRILGDTFANRGNRNLGIVWELQCVGVGLQTYGSFPQLQRWLPART
jgi:hypothetical protein